MRRADLQTIGFSLGLVLRAMAIGAIAVLSYQMLSLHRFASLFLLSLLALALVLDLLRHARLVDRQLSRLISAVEANEPELSGRGKSRLRGLGHMSEAMSHLQATISEMRRSQQAQIDHFRSLTDTVTAALFVVQESGGITSINRAAHRLEEMGVLESDLLRLLAASRPGSREVVRLSNGQRILALTVSYSAEGETQKLISLQSIESELDAVEIKAWQDLVRILSHEMMNSLTPIASLAQSLRPLTENAEAGEALTVIENRSRALMQFVARYREVAEMPRVNLHSVPVLPLLKSIEQLFSTEAKAHGISLLITVQPSDLSANVDPYLIEQALINLVRNAVEAVADTPMPTINLRAFNADEAVCIEVMDNGKGLSEEVRERLFVPFFTTRPNGSGIGLSLTRQIAIAHGGQIEVLSTHPAGATFRLTLPG
ncbi:MAG: ATP-binding protein [Asticcacaulis sp.]|uniref:sensor histidine kinase n=1 Tax=Asticcacaulis sp. TaxID=1872648 RepID=UPI0039E3FF5A